MRLFFALFPPKEIRDEMRDVIRRFSKYKKNLKPLPIDQLHITLKHIGPKVSENSMQLIAEEFLANPYPFEAPKVEIERITFGFERETFPKLLVARIKDNPDLKDLASYHQNLVRGLKLRDTITWKKYTENSFHITLARLKPTATNSSGKLIKEFNKTQTYDFKVNTFIPDGVFLVNSEQSLGKPNVYTKLEHNRLITPATPEVNI